MFLSIAEWLQQSSSSEKELFTKTISHPFLKDYIMFMSTRAIAKISNPDFVQTASNGDWNNPVEISLDSLFEDIKRQGMRDPLFLGIGIDTKKVRLEMGNQRVQIFLNHNIPYLPVVAYLSRHHITHEKHGLHDGVPAQLKFTFDYNYFGPYSINQFMSLDSILHLNQLEEQLK